MPLVSTRSLASYHTLGLYIHVPWCHRRCPYCDFYFEIAKPDARFSEYLAEDWQFKRQILLPEARQDPLETLYFGGGTPSRLPLKDLADILIFFGPMLKTQAEVTLEANPEDVTADNARVWAELGITRLSLGVQSLENSVLHWLGRKHRSSEAKAAIQIASQYFEQVSVDLIVGVPGESLSDIQNSIKWIKDAGIGHVSAYILGIEPTAPLYRLIKRGVRTLPSETDQANAYAGLQKMLRGVGYAQYEVSSFSVPGEESRHNRTYWGKGQYIGLGPSAHSMVRLADGKIFRFSSERDFKKWAQDPASALDLQEKLMPYHAFLEALAFGCRDIQLGVDMEGLAALHEIEILSSTIQVLADLSAQGYIWRSGSFFGLDCRQALFADHVSRELLGSG